MTTRTAATVTETRQILDEIEGALAFQITISNLYSLQECRITTPRAREIVARIKRIKKSLATPQPPPQYFQKLDRYFEM